MTKKDFELIARILADNREGSEDVIDTLARQLAAEFESGNPRFDTTRFIEATHPQ